MGLAKIIRNKQVLILFSFILFMAIVYVAESHFIRRQDIKFLSIIIILFLGFLVLFIRHMKAVKGASQLERSIKAQAEDQRILLRPGKKEEIDELRQYLINAIDSLKKSKLGHGRSGKSALYVLPWYMFIGPPAAGKTTALINSGLEFQFGSDIKGVGGTRNCDWFFSSSAILLDTAGRYVSEDEDREEWLAFLEILRKYRKGKPINGVMVGMSMADMLSEDLETIDWHAKNIRRRIDELIQKLGVRFPVYLIFTKCDLIQGFVDFFENYSRKEREQIWGCTLPLEHKPVLEPRGLFEREFQLLLDSLNEIRLERLSKLVKSESRNRVFVFPLQYASLRDKISYFINRLFQANPYSETPIFRGFYFTSGTQEGVPVDMVIQAISKQFELAPDMMTRPEVEKKSYFIRNLFTEVIVPDRNMVTRTSKSSRHRNFVRAALTVASIVLLGAFIIGVTRTYFHSKSFLQSLHSAADQTGTIRWDSRSLSLENFDKLRKLSNMLGELEQRRSLSLLGFLRLDPGNIVIQPLRRLYYRKLYPFVQTFVFNELQARLYDYRENMNIPPIQAYDLLRAYLLLGPNVQKLDEEQRKFLGPELVRIFEESHSRVFPEGREEELQTLIKAQVETFVGGLGKEGTPPFKADSDLIRDVKNAIPKKFWIQKFYEDLKSGIQTRDIRDFTIADAIGTQNEYILMSSIKVPALFTRAGWETYVRPTIKSISTNPSFDDWVLDIEEEDLKENSISAELSQIYAAGYIEAWWNFLRSLQYGDFDSLESAQDALRRLGDPKESPLRQLIDRVTQETSLVPETRSGQVQKYEAQAQDHGVLKKDPSEKPIAEISRSFESLHALSSKEGEEGKPADELKSILAQYASVSVALEAMRSELGPRAKECAGKNLQTDSGEFASALRTIRASLSTFDPELKRLFEEPLIKSWTVVLNAAGKFLNSLWQQKVCDVFQNKLASGYPFYAKGQDVPLKELENFFRPQTGTIWAFVESELKPFIDSATWQSKTWEGQGLTLSSNAVETLNKAALITRMLFTQGNEIRIKFWLQPEMPPLTFPWASKVELISLAIDGERFEFDMGPNNWKDFSWPGSKGVRGAVLSVVIRDNYLRPLQYDGDWGWLRLLQEAKVVSDGPAQGKIIWQIGKEKEFSVSYKLKTEDMENLFFAGASVFDFRCLGPLF